MKLDLCLRPLLLAVLSVLVVGGGTSDPAPESTAAKAKPADKAAVAKSFAKQPMRFETDGAGHVLGHARGASVALDADGATLAVRGKNEALVKVGMRVAGGRAVTPIVSDELITKINDLRGRDPKAWRRNVATYGKVTYPSVLDGVDLVFHGEQGQLEYDFVVAPGADPRSIALNIDGAASLTETGDLAIEIGNGQLVQQRPRVYQRDAEGVEHDVKAGYRLADGKVAFNVADYDRALPLVIDPVIGWATFVGGQGNDDATDIAVAGGNAYVSGWTSQYFGFAASDFTNQGGTAPAIKEVRGTRGDGGPPYMGRDATVAKLDSAGRLVYLTILGGGQDDEAGAIAVDSAGRVYVTGYTESSDMTVTKNAAQPALQANTHEVDRDAFLLALNADGSDVTYATYLDIGTNFQAGMICPDAAFGCEFAYNDRGTSIAVVDATHVYIGGMTESAGRINVDGALPAEDASETGLFVAQVTAPADTATAGAISKKVLLGGGSGGTADGQTGIAVVGTNVFVGGQVCAAVAGTPNGFQTAFRGGCDGFVAQLDADLKTTWSSYLGGTGDDSVTDLAALPDGHIYVTGHIGKPTDEICQTPCTPPISVGSTSVQGEGDAFVAHLNPADGAASVKWMRLLGGAYDDWATGIAVDPIGHAYVIGTTASNDFPTTPSVPRNDESFNDDAFVSELSIDGATVLLSQFYGASDSWDTGAAIALATDGIFFCGTSITLTQRDGAPITTRAFPNTKAATQDRIAYDDEFVAKIQIDVLKLTPDGTSVAPKSVTKFTAAGGFGTGYVYDIATLNSGNGAIDKTTGDYTAGDTAGTDTVRVTDAAGNTATATITVAVPNSSSSGTSGTSSSSSSSSSSGTAVVADAGGDGGGLAPIGVGSPEGDDDGCSVGRVGSRNEVSSAAFAGLALALALAARRRRR